MTSFSEMEQLVCVTEPVGLLLASLCFSRKVFRWWNYDFLPLIKFFYVDSSVFEVLLICGLLQLWVASVVPWVAGL